MDVTADGAILVLCEEAPPPPGPASTNTTSGGADAGQVGPSVSGWLVAPGGGATALRYRTRDGLAPMALALLPPEAGGAGAGRDFLVLERAWSMAAGSVVSLRLLTAAALAAAAAASPAAAGESCGGCVLEPPEICTLSRDGGETVDNYEGLAAVPLPPKPAGAGAGAGGVRVYLVSDDNSSPQQVGGG
jgi:hypothetical protein